MCELFKEITTHFKESTIKPRACLHVNNNSYSVTPLSVPSVPISLSSTVYESTGLVFPDSQRMRAASGELVHSLCLITGGDGTGERGINDFDFILSDISRVQLERGQNREKTHLKVILEHILRQQNCHELSDFSCSCGSGTCLTSHV